MVQVLTNPLPAIAGQDKEFASPWLNPLDCEVPPCLDELLGTVAHELRSSLATVLSGVYMINSECELDQVARRALPLMERQLQQAMRLVDDLFDICAGSLRKLTLCKEVVVLAKVVDGETEAADHLLSARRHRLTVSLPP